MGKVTDPALLAQLDGGKVTDPALLSRLEGSAAPVGKAEALLRGTAQGATMGFGDELEAGWKSMLGGGKYKDIRDKLRGDEQNAQSQHPYMYGAGEMAGSLAPMAAGGGATAGTRLLMAAGQGAAQGAGYSNAGDARSLVRDTALGAGVGVGGFGLGEALSGVGRGLVRFARRGSTAAAAKAGEQAAEEVAAKIASAKGALGGEVQKGSRQIENMMRFEESLTPEQRAVWNELQLSAERTPAGTLKTAYETGTLPVAAPTAAERIPATQTAVGPVQALRERVAQSTLDALPSQADTIAANDAELAALKQGASEAFNARKGELLAPGEALRQLKARAWRYGPVAAGTLIGTSIGGPVGSAVGALAGAGSRPMIQSMRRLAQNPAVQKATFEALANAADSKPGDLLRQLLSRGGAAAATQSLVTE